MDRREYLNRKVHSKGVAAFQENDLEQAREMDISDEVSRIQAVYARWEPTLDRSNVGYQRSLRERNDKLKRILDERFERPRSSCRVLDIGCGYGGLLGWFNEQGVSSNNLYGVDLLPNRIKRAREAYPNFAFTEGSAEHLDFPDEWFDLVTVFTVFSSILDELMAKKVARNIARVLKSDGAIVWYDMRFPNPWNPNVMAMTKRRIEALFPSHELDLEPLSLMPPIARRLGPATNAVYPLLASIPALRSHYMGLLRPRAAKPSSFPC